MNTLRALSFRRIVAAVTVLGATILLAQSAHAQRPSIGQLQAQIIGLGPLTPAQAQVRTALDLLPPFQEAVVNAFRAAGEAPATRIDAGLTANSTDTSTTFITSVDIINGTIIVWFGNSADPSINSEFMSFTPYETPDLTVVWRCGADPAPISAALLGTSGGGQRASYVFPSIPAATYPDPCILKTQSGSPDEVIRAQILEAFDVVETMQDAIEAAGAALGSPTMPTPPMDRAQAGLTIAPTDTLGNYFNSVNIVFGTVTVTYGNEANNFIRGESLSFTPYESPDGTIVWRCGDAVAPANAQLMGTLAGGNTAVYIPPSAGMLPKYRPPYCRL